MITLLILIAIAAIIIFALLCVCGVIASALSGVIFVIADIAIAVLILRLAFGGHKKERKSKAKRLVETLAFSFLKGEIKMIPIKGIIGTVGKFCSKNSSTLLSIGACLGVVATGYFGVKAGMQLQDDLLELKVARMGEETAKEKATVIVKDCATTVAVGGLTMAMIASSRIIDIRRAKAMAASYALLAESSDRFRRKVAEHIGDKEMEKVNCEMAREEMDKIDFNKVQAVNTGHGNFWCEDEITRQPFLACSDWILGRKRDLDLRCGQGEDYISVSEWYSYLGLKPPIEKVGDLVWPASMGVPLELYEDHLPSITMENGEPGYYLRYITQPMTKEEADIYNANHYIDSWDY